MGKKKGNDGAKSPGKPGVKLNGKNQKGAGCTRCHGSGSYLDQATGMLVTCNH